MPLEFELIQQFFNNAQAQSDVVCGIGDDAAILSVACGDQLVVTADTLIRGVHFPNDTLAEDIGFKSLAVNLSDLAAMGATPRWFTLSLTLPEADTEWLAGFSSGLFDLAQKEGIALVGGDTTRGPLSITIQAMGTVSGGGGVRRSTAEVGDDLYVTGTLGDAALGLAGRLRKIMLESEDFLFCNQRLNRPRPRVATGLALQGYVHSMIDCSDGFVADLGHILSASHKGAEIYLHSLPLSDAVRRWVEQESGWQYPLYGGDDYELIFSAPVDHRTKIAAFVDALGVPISKVGTVIEQPGLQLYAENGDLVNIDQSGYTHF